MGFWDFLFGGRGNEAPDSKNTGSKTTNGERPSPTATANHQGQEKTVQMKAPNPKIKAVTWGDKAQGGKKINKAKYGKEIALHIDTEEAYGRLALVIVHCDDWIEDYVGVVGITKYNLINTGTTKLNQFGLPEVDHSLPEKTFFRFTPKAEWLSNPTVNSSEIVTEVYLIWNLWNAGKDNSFELKRIATAIKRDSNDYRNFVSGAAQKPVILAEKQANKIRISKFTIIIDPGHGGRDPGVPAYKNIRHEKDIVLIVGRYLRDLLSAAFPNNGIKIVMTRDDDVFPSLSDRVTTSTENSADLFISIHVDSGGVDKVVNGVKTTVYNEIIDTVRVFQRIISNDLTRILSENITAELNNVVTSNRDVENTIGNHHVTREQAEVVGAVLIEIGFITNRRQEDLMNTDPYLLSIATAIRNGVINTMSNVN